MVDELAEQAPEEPMVPEELAVPQDDDAAIEKDPTPVRSALLGIGLYLLFFIAITGFNALHLQMPLVLWFIVPLITTVGYLVILVNAIRLMCHLSLSKKQETKIMFSALLVYILLNSFLWGLVRLYTATDSATNSNSSRFTVILYFFSSKIEWALDNLFQLGFFKPLDFIEPFLLIIVGVFFGQLISRLIKERAILIPVAVVSSLVDFWGVYWGPVNAMSINMPGFVGKVGSAATVATAAPTSEIVSRQIEQVTASSPLLKMFANVAPPSSIGLGDFVFLAFFLTCAWKLGFSTRRTMWGIFVGLLISSMLMALQGLTVWGHEISFEYLPGLPFICAGVVFANLKVWKLSKQEWLMTGVLALLLFTLIGGTAWRNAANAPVSIPTVHHIVTAPTVKEAIQTALKIGQQQASNGKAAGTELVLLQAEVGYSREEAGFAVLGFNLLVLGRKPMIKKENDTWDQFLVGRPAPNDPSKWYIEQDATRPSGKAIGVAQMLFAKESVDELEGARKATGVAKELDILDHIEDYQELIGDAKDFSVIVVPGKVALKIDNQFLRLKLPE